MKNAPSIAGRAAALRAVLPAAVAVAATYVYFLLYAQYGFLRLLAERGASAAVVERALGAMGLAGLVASLGGVWLLARWPAVAVLRAGLAGGGLTAVAALACQPRWLIAAAALVGASTALATVALASRLRTFAGGAALGLTVGLGTGVAYLVSNVPALFEGAPATQALAAAAACAFGLAAAGRFRRGDETPPAGGRAALGHADFTVLGLSAVVVSFLALIWLDSAAFAIIQATPVLKAATWGGSGKLVIGVTHLAAALLAGAWIDRGGFHGLLAVTFGLFATAFQLLAAGGQAAFLAGPLYAAGISLYSVALVVYPSYGGDRPGWVPRRWRAAVLYGVAGWLGSALGVGLARAATGRAATGRAATGPDLDHIPPSLIWIAGGLLLLARLPRGGRALRLLRAHAVTLAFGVAAALVFGPLAPATSSPRLAADDGAAVARGRRVYVEEGCINCHSQYVRPTGGDRDLFGPVPAAAGGGSPPLYGNRRQGPDLTNAGARRSASWHRLHLQEPRALSPGSRMPSYGHLFAGDGSRGDDLVAYLTSLGGDAGPEWYASVRAYPMGESFTGGSAERGRMLFGRYCAACHGAHGDGRGPLSAAIYRPAMNLGKGAFWGVSWGAGAESEELALARVVKFGLPGTSMPGHETLADRDVADLAAWVRELNRTGKLADNARPTDPETDHAG